MSNKYYIQKSQVYKKELDGSNMCLTTNKNGQIYFSDKCLDTNPFTIFYVLNKIIDGNNKNITIISPIVGQCVGIDKNNNIIYDATCSEKSILTVKNNTICNEDGCIIGSNNLLSETHVYEIVEDEKNPVRVYWNVEEMVKLRENIKKGTFWPDPFPGVDYDKAKFEFAQKVMIGNAVSVSKYIPNSMGINNNVLGTLILDTTNEDTMKKIARLVFARISVIGKTVNNCIDLNEPNPLVCWTKFRSRNPKLCFLLAAAGSGKSSILPKLVDMLKLQNPIHISYDLPYDCILENFLYTHLEQLGFPIRASDRKIRDELYNISARIEEEIIKIVDERKLDCIEEKADIPQIDYIEQRSKTHDIIIVFMSINEDQRFINMGNRFKNSGRYGSVHNSMSQHEISKFMDICQKKGYETHFL